MNWFLWMNEWRKKRNRNLHKISIRLNKQREGVKKKMKGKQTTEWLYYNKKG